MEKKLPNNWLEVELGDIADITAGIGFPIIHQGNLIGRIPFYKVGDISKTVVRGDRWLTNADNYIDEATLKKLKGKLLPHGTIVFAKIGEALKLNRRAMISEPSLVDNNVMAVIPYYSDMDKFIFYFLLTESLDKFSAGNAVPSVRKSSVLSIPFPLPPLPEQQRIVAKLDTLFGHLDALKTCLERIPQSLKEFRQKVLTQAVTGKLTEEWREGRELEEWNESPLNEFSISRLGKMLDKEKNQGIPTKYLRNINVRWFDFDLDDLFEIKVSEEEMQKYSIQDGDVLVCEGGEPGRAAIWRNGNTNIIFQKALHRIRLNNNVLPEFLLYNLKVDSVNNVLSSLFTGTTIKHLTGVAFSDYTINIPPLVEQQEIVRRVETLFAKADQIEAGYQKLKAKIDQLPQALLAKAFRGELVPQLPTDGDAKELLEEIKKAKGGK